MNSENSTKKALKINGLKLLSLTKQLLFILSLLMLTRLIFYVFNLEYYPNMTTARALKILQGALSFDIAALFFINLPYLVLYLLPFPFTLNKIYNKFLAFWFYVTNSAAIATNLGDCIYYDFTLKRSTTEVFMFAQESNSTELLKSFLLDYWYMFLIGFVIIALIIFAFNKMQIKNFPKSYSKKTFAISGTIALLIFSAIAIIGIRGHLKTREAPINLNTAGEYAEKIQDIALILNTPFSMIKTIKKQHLEKKNYYTEEAVNKIFNPIHNQTNNEAFKNLNVIIIVMESMSSQYSKILNPDLEQTYSPNLDSIIHKSLLYPLAFANGRKSIQAFPAICASIPHVMNSHTRSVYATNTVTSLSTELKKKGYSTSFFHGADNGSLGINAFMNLAGYSKYFGRNEYNNDADHDGTWGIWDDKFFDFFIEKISEFKQPFHTVFFSLSAHQPFVIPKSFEEKFKHIESEQIKSFAYSDYALGKFFDKAKNKKWFKNSLFIITGDHGTQPIAPKYKSLVGSHMVPIIYYCPADSTLTGIDSTLTQHIDIMPTVLNYLNYNTPYFSLGNDIFDETKKNEVFINRNNLWQYLNGEFVIQYGNEKLKAMYNYEKDIYLKTNILNENKTKAEEMLKRLKAFIQIHNKRMIDNQLTQDTTATQKRQYKKSV